MPKLCVESPDSPSSKNSSIDGGFNSKEHCHLENVDNKDFTDEVALMKPPSMHHSHKSEINLITKMQ